MKKVLIIMFFALFEVSCVTVSVKSLDIVSVLDYSPLTSKGIFVTESNSVGFEYEAIGSIYIEMRNGTVKKSNQSKNRDEYDIIYSSKHNRSPQSIPERSELTKQKSYNIDDAVKRLAYELQNLDANGIINLKIQHVETNITHGEGYVITGMAIKR